MSPTRMRPLAASLLFVFATTCRPTTRISPVPESQPAAAGSARVVAAHASGVSLDGVPTTPRVDTLVLRRPDYRYLVRAIARYRALADDSTIPVVPRPARLPVSPGDTMPMVPALRDRLVALGDLDRASAASASDDVYTGALVDAVRRYQRRHGLAEDGIIGPSTLAALRTPLALRVAQLEAAAELIRREPPLNGGPFIIVDVPAFRLFAYDSPADSVPALDMRVIVGRAAHWGTPSLTAELRYVDFWPAWDVPKSIMLKELLPAMARDSLYLRTQDMELVTRAGESAGDTVTASVLDSLRAGALRVRQRSGPGNPLGRVKFVFPNDSNIYLHDTPDPVLFARTRRDFSHGCIRVARARDLAVWVTRSQPNWTADSVDVALVGPDTRRVLLARPIRVIVEYVTAMATADGTVWFLPDIYARNIRRIDQSPQSR